MILVLLASMRRMRRTTLRYVVEQERIETWLALIRLAASSGDYEAALELAECQRLVKGYGDTHERGLRNYNAIIGLWPILRTTDDPAASIMKLRNAALADDEGAALNAEISGMAA